MGFKRSWVRIPPARFCFSRYSRSHIQDVVTQCLARSIRSAGGDQDDSAGALQVSGTQSCRGPWYDGSTTSATNYRYTSQTDEPRSGYTVLQPVRRGTCRTPKGEDLENVQTGSGCLRFDSFNSTKRSIRRIDWTAAPSIARPGRRLRYAASKGFQTTSIHGIHATLFVCRSV